MFRQVTLAVPQGKGKPPLGLSLLARPKTDQRLAEVAGEVAPMLRAVVEGSVPALTPRQEGSSPAQAKGSKPIDSPFFPKPPITCWALRGEDCCRLW